MLVLGLGSEPLMAKRRQNRLAPKPVVTSCARQFAGYGIGLGVAAVLVAFGYLRSPEQVAKPQAVTSAVGVESDKEVRATMPVFSKGYQAKLDRTHRSLSEAGEQGITDLKDFEALYADEEMRGLWSKLVAKYGYRIVGRHLPSFPNRQIHIPAMSNPDLRLIVVNLERERFGMVDLSFVLVNELWDLEFYHHVIDVQQNPSPFSLEFRQAYDSFFAANADMRKFVPTDPMANSAFIIQQVMSLWMEKRSYLRQFDWYLQTRETFPEIIRPHLEQIAGRDPEEKRHYLIRHFSNPPYSMSPVLSQRLWDHPLPVEFSYP